MNEDSLLVFLCTVFSMGVLALEILGVYMIVDVVPEWNRVGFRNLPKHLKQKFYTGWAIILGGTVLLLCSF